MRQSEHATRNTQHATLPVVATFSIVGHDPRNGDLGIAVQSKFVAVGAVVPWARAGVGAVATQAWANTTYGPAALQALAAGRDPQQVIAARRRATQAAPSASAGSWTRRGGPPPIPARNAPPGRAGAAAPISPRRATSWSAATRWMPWPRRSWSSRAAAAGELRPPAGGAGGGPGGGWRQPGMQVAALLVVRPAGGYAGLQRPLY